MVGSVSSNTMIPQMAQGSGSSNSLTSSQLETISSVLENYDANNLSESDAQAIVEAFEEVGITPGAELASAMSDAGFDAKEVGDLAGVAEQQGGMMPPPPPPEEEVSSISSLLDTLLNTEDEESSTTSFEDIMDYTSRILSLNEESKTEVMDLLEQYSGDTEYSQEETNALLKTSLSQILSDSNNYKSVSFYG